MKPPRSLRFRHIRGLACANSNRKPGHRVNGPGQTRRFSPDASHRKSCGAGRRHREAVMAVSKRLRFEILRRDNHACRYCGQIAPDVRLTIDHIIPVALGGSDDPTNLVCACSDCNSGKSSITIDSPIVDDVGRRAAEWAEARAEAMQTWREDVRAAHAEADKFIAKWNNWQHDDGSTVPIDDQWRVSFVHWRKVGFTLDDLTPMIPIAMTKQGLRRGEDDIWPYFCGIVWRTLDDIEAAAEATVRQTEAARQDDGFDAEHRSVFDALFAPRHEAPHPSSRYVEPSGGLSGAQLDHVEWLAEMHMDDAATRYESPRAMRDIFASMFGPGD